MTDKGVLLQDITNVGPNSLTIPSANRTTNSTTNKAELDAATTAELTAVSTQADMAPTVVTTTITSAELLALNTTPKQLIAAPGAGYAIAVESVYCSLDYGSAAYATNTDLEIRYDGAAAGDATGAEVTVDTLDAILLLTADAVYRTPGLGSDADTALTINKGVSAIIGTGNPITGDSPITITVTYRTIAV